ncbi:MAG: mechanosensitive ion channel [Deltaproteobacteria bacterium]|nr:mechanosensitive ion channel [Deltaproteobacteria bacterium]
MSPVQWAELRHFFTETALAWSVNFLGAVAILVVGWYLSRLAGRATGRATAHLRHMDPTLRPLLVSLIHYGLLAATLMAVLARFGVQTTSLVAVLGAAGLAIGLALQGTLSNVAAGVMLLLLRPFKVGEYIEVIGKDGTVLEIGLFTTELATADNLFVSLPNSSIWGAPIVNYSRLPLRRINLIFSVSYGDDIGGAIQVLERVMEADGRFATDPPRVVAVHALGPSSVDLLFRGFVPTEDYWLVRWATQRAAKEALTEAGFTIPFPQQTVHLARE